MRTWAILATVVVLCVCAPAFSAVWYVDKDNASGTEDGTTWATAFTTIQPAIDAAHADGGGEVWVAEGVYDEPRSFLGPDEDGDELSLAPLVKGFVGTLSRRVRSPDEPPPLKIARMVSPRSTAIPFFTEYT